MRFPEENREKKVEHFQLASFILRFLSGRGEVISVTFYLGLYQLLKLKRRIKSLTF